MLKNNKMKKSILISILLIFVFNLNFSQIDRSKQPESGPDPEIKFGTPKTFKLKNGIQVLIVEDNKLPVVTYSLRIDRNPIIEGEKVGVSSILSAMLGNGTKNIPKDEYNEEVEFLGASVSVTFRGGSANTLTKNNDRVLELWADAIINPLFSEDEFKSEKKKLIESLKSNVNNIDAIASRVSSALSYGKNHPYGEFTTQESLENVTFEDVIEFHKTYYIPNNAYLVVVGDVKAKEIKSVLKEKFGGWKKGKLPENPEPLFSDNVPETEINFIDVPSATQSTVIFTNNTTLKPSDEDYFAALIANQILGGGSEGYLFKNLRDDNGWTYGAYSNLGSSRYGISRFTAETKVRNAVTDSTVAEIINEIIKIREQRVDPQRLKDVKAAYLGNFIFSTERASTIANFALNLRLNNLPDDYYETFIENINNVTAEDVKKAAQKYIKLANTRIIIVGRGGDVVENLEKSEIKINYYDKFANPVAKPVFNKPLPEGLVALDIINNYINSIGGRQKLISVKTLISNGELELPAGTGQQVILTLKQKMPNKESIKQKLLMGGQVVMEGGQSFDGETGYIQGPQGRINMDEETVIKKKAVKGIFEELYYTGKELELINISNINGEDSYKIKITEGSKISYRYYSISSGYLLSVESEDKNKNLTSVIYSDFRPVEGIIFPFKFEQKGQKINISEIILNQEIKDSSF